MDNESENVQVREREKIEEGESDIQILNKKTGASRQIKKKKKNREYV